MLDIKPVETLIYHLQKNVLPVAAPRALNKSVKAGQSVGVKQIAKDIGIKQGLVRKALKMVKAHRHCHRAILQVTHNKRLTILQIDPQAKQLDSGVRYRLGQKRQLIPQAFIAVMKSGHQGVFKRIGKSRLPIRELKGPGISHVFMKEAIQQAICETVENRWPLCLKHEIDFLARK